MKFLSNSEFWNSRPMMVGYSLSILITLGACKTRNNLTQKERENIRVLDSIIQTEKQSLIIDYNEEFKK